MMQFTETPPLPRNGGGGQCSNTMNKNLHHRNHHRPTWAGFPTSTKSLTTTSTTFGDATCMEQLLLHCATAIESNDATLAQQILWVLNNTATPDGDSNQRLTSAFLRALVARAARTGTCQLLAAIAPASPALPTHHFSVIDLASFVDLTPWHRFGFAAANAAILDALNGFSAVHIIDLSSTHCMQIPTLLDSLAARPDGPPFVRLTVASAADPIPPLLDLSYDQLGARLVNFARSRNVGMEFKVVPSTSSDGFALLVEHLRQQQQHRDCTEALVINCQMMLRYVPDETLANPACYSPSSLRSTFIKHLRGLDPNVVILVDEDADFTSTHLVSRLRSAFNFLWIPYDTVDTFLPRGSKQRQWYEADVGWKIENVIACEGEQRVERLEPKSKWVQRMRGTGFRGVGFGEEAVSEVKSMLEEHAAGWGFKKEEEDLVLTWKGHNVAFASAWVPF